MVTDLEMASKVSEFTDNVGSSFPGMKICNNSCAYLAFFFECLGFKSNSTVFSLWGATTCTFCNFLCTVCLLVPEDNVVEIKYNLLAK